MKFSRVVSVLQGGLLLLGFDSLAHAATFTVTNTASSGPGSLSQAIQDANIDTGLDTIAFNIPPFDGQVKTIQQTNTLTAITSPVVINGYTQPGSSSNTLAGATNNAVLLVQLTTTNDLLGIIISAGGCTVRGLAMNGFTQGVTIQPAAPSNVVEGCFIGTNPTGVRAGTPANSIGITCGSAFNRIGGTQPWQRNLISGNSDTGVNFAQGTSATDNIIQGNFIGTDAQGLSAIPNGQGIRLYSHGNVVGGTNAAARNVISGNSGDAIDLLTGNSNTIQGCYLGIDATGAATLPNGAGLRIQAASVNKIGGSAPGAGNTIGGNADYGIGLLGGSFNQIDGNFIGTDSAGVVNFGNTRDGITIGGAAGTSNTIGIAAANLIAYNGNRGLNCGSGVDSTTVEGNLIYSNATQGIVADSVHNRITRNSIFDNGLLGIDLIGGSGSDANDHCDPDSGGNDLQNYPVLTNAVSDAFSVTIAGFLDSAPSTSFRLEFFANLVCDPSGFGEGQIFLGATNVTTGANCMNSFVVTLPFPVPGGAFITATATDPDGNTSEFSACRQVTGLVFPPGDVNGDRRVTGADSLLINQVLVGLRMSNDAIFTAATFANGDANQNNSVGGSDSLLINQVLVGLRAYATTKIVPGSRTNTTPVLATVFGIGIPTNTLSGVTIGPPVNLSATQLIPVSPFQIITLVPAGGGTGTGVVNAVATPTNGVISFGRFINQ